MKRLTCLFLALLAISLPSAGADSAGEARDWAAEAGFPDEFLNMAWDDLLLQVYNQNHEAEELRAVLDGGDDPYVSNGVSSSRDGLTFRLLTVTQSTEGMADKVNIYMIFKWDEDTRMKYRTDHMSFYYDGDRWGADISHSALTRVYGCGSDEPYIDTTAISWVDFQEVGQDMDIKWREGPPYGVVSFTLYPLDVYGTAVADGDSFSAEYIHNYQGRDDPFFGKPILFTIPWWLVAVILVLFHWLVWKIRKKKRK